MGAKANYTRCATKFHNTNNGLAVFSRLGAESFGSRLDSRSIRFRFGPARSGSRPARGRTAPPPAQQINKTNAASLAKMRARQ